MGVARPAVQRRASIRTWSSPKPSVTSSQLFSLHSGSRRCGSCRGALGGLFTLDWVISPTSCRHFGAQLIGQSQVFIVSFLIHLVELLGTGSLLEALDFRIRMGQGGDIVH